MKPLTVICVGATLFLAGCGSGKTVTNESGDGMDEARRYEADFKPSEFDPDPDAILGKSSATKKDTVTPREEVLDPNELVTGFRVQIFSTTNIDDANNARDSAQAQFSIDRFYVVYDPPTYKVRGGDFLTRYDADKFARQLRDRGYRDAWVVPEKVRKSAFDPTPR